MARRRAPVFGAPALLLVVAASTVLASSSAAPPSAWRRPVALVPPGSYTFAPRLAVAEDGQMIAGWFAGARPRTCACGLVRVAPTAHRRQPAAPRPQRPSGTKVVIDPGSLPGGFQRPIVLSDDGTDGEGDLQVAVSGSHTAYAAWTEARRGWRIVALRGRRLSRPVWLPHTAQLKALLSPPRGPVLAVWAQFPPPHRWSLDYAPLTSSGRLGKPVKIADIGSRDSAEGYFSLNDRGELAVTWTRSGSPPQPRSSTMLVICEPQRPCSKPQALGLPAAQPKYEEPAVAVDGDGTVTAFLAGHDSGASSIERVDGRVHLVPGSETNYGLWAATFASAFTAPEASLISSLGASPVAVPYGQTGTAVAFQVREPKQPTVGFAIALRPTAGVPFEMPKTISEEGVPFPPTLAANADGRLLAVWDQHSGSGSAERHALRALSVEGERFGAVEPVPDGGAAAGTSPEIGIDEHGEAVVLWNGPGCKAGPNCGMFASLREG